MILKPTREQREQFFWISGTSLPPGKFLHPPISWISKYFVPLVPLKLKLEFLNLGSHQMPYEFSCFICSKKVNRSKKKAHLFSDCHSQDIWNAILKKKQSFTSWIQSIEEGKRPTIVPSIYFTKSTRSFKICLACNTIEPSTDMFVVCSCGEVIRNALAIKNILLTKTFKENPLYQKSMAIESKTVDIQTEGGGGDSEKLQKEITRLKKRIEFDEKVVDEAQETSDALYTIMDYLQDYDLNVMIGAMKKLKALHPAVYEAQKKNFGESWDDSLISEED
jgi:hypothetical protein